MKNKTLYYIWAGLYALCFGLSLISAPSGALQVVMTVLSIAFFLPPVCLLVNAYQEQDAKTVKTIRLLSILSLGLTVLLFLLNILSMAGSEILGNILYYVLVFFSVPMVCCGSYALSLFLWACVLFSTFFKKAR
nr:hypothetical protein [Oscillospiraceae bacterium]